MTVARSLCLRRRPQSRFRPWLTATQPCRRRGIRDPVDPASFRYWDGVAWTRLTKLIPPPAPVPVDEGPGNPSHDAGSSLDPEVARSEIVATEEVTERTPDNDGDTSAGEGSADPSVTSADEESADHWVKEADKAVATAVSASTPTAWRSAAQAAVVVAEIAQTMRVTTHAHQIAQQLAFAAEEAAAHAHSAQEAVDDAMRTANHATQAAEEAAQEARDAAADRRRRAGGGLSKPPRTPRKPLQRPRSRRKRRPTPRPRRTGLTRSSRRPKRRIPRKLGVRPCRLPRQPAATKAVLTSSRLAQSGVSLVRRGGPASDWDLDRSPAVWHTHRYAVERPMRRRTVAPQPGLDRTPRPRVGKLFWPTMSMRQLCFHMCPKKFIIRFLAR